MTYGNPEPSAIARAEALQQKMGALTDAIRDLGAQARRQRRHTRLIAVSLVVDALVTIGLGVTAWQSAEASSAAHEAKVANHSSCVSTNEVRHGIRAVWDELLADVAAGNPTAAGRADIAMLRHQVTTTYAPKDCND